MSNEANKTSFVTALEKQDMAAISQSKIGRPRVHSTNSKKTIAYRTRNVRIDVTVPPPLANTLTEISSDLDCSRNVLLNSLVRFALLNRNWRVLGLFGKR